MSARALTRLSPFNMVSLALGFTFLYVPLVILIIYSFNESKLGIRWTGFTTKWYGSLLQNDVLLSSFKSSMIVASFTTVLATILGTMAAAVECECDGNIPVTADDLRSKIDVVERQMAPA